MSAGFPLHFVDDVIKGATRDAETVVEAGEDCEGHTWPVLRDIVQHTKLHTYKTHILEMKKCKEKGERKGEYIR